MVTNEEIAGLHFPCLDLDEFMNSLDKARKDEREEIVTDLLSVLEAIRRGGKK